MPGPRAACPLTDPSLLGAGPLPPPMRQPQVQSQDAVSESPGVRPPTPSLQGRLSCLHLMCLCSWLPQSPIWSPETAPPGPSLSGPSCSSEGRMRSWGHGDLVVNPCPTLQLATARFQERLCPAPGARGPARARAGFGQARQDSTHLEISPVSCSPCPVPHALRPVSCALHPVLCTLCLVPCALHPVSLPCALCPAPCVLALCLVPCALCPFPVPCALRPTPHAEWGATAVTGRHSHSKPPFHKVVQRAGEGTSP